MGCAMIEGLRLVVDPVAAPSVGGRRWCASARVSGSRDGAPFTMVLDLFGVDFATQEQAVRYGQLKAEARVLQLLERRALP